MLRTGFTFPNIPTPMTVVAMVDRGHFPGEDIIPRPPCFAKRQNPRSEKFGNFRGLFMAFFLLFSVVAMAQNEALFEGATTAYNEGDYEKAISNYEQILGNGEHSAALYFNLGNAHYKLNQVGPSIYYYEKALLLEPTDAEIRNNLAYAQNMTLDAIEKMPETGFSKIYNALTGFLTFDQWAGLAILFLILFVATYIAFYYFRYSSRKRTAFVISILCLFIAITSLVVAYMRYQDFSADRPAIVFAKEVSIQSEPNNIGQPIFTLHEGTKVHILDSLNDWYRIRIADGKSGWLATTAIKPLKDF